MPTRRLMTKGLYNARDLGGFPTADGKTTRFGVFVRSEAPVDLPEEDIAYLRDYGVTASMDFRSTGETLSRPSDLRELLPYYHRSLFNEAAMAGSAPHPPKKIGWGEQYIEMDFVMFGREALGHNYLMSVLLSLAFAVIVNVLMYFRMKKIDMIQSLKSVE